MLRRLHCTRARVDLQLVIDTLGQSSLEVKNVISLLLVHCEVSFMGSYFMSFISKRVNSDSHNSSYCYVVSVAYFCLLGKFSVT